MGNKIRVLMVTSTIGVCDGVSTFVMNYCRQLDWDHICVDIATYDEKALDSGSPYIKQIEGMGGRIFCLPGLSNIRRHFSELSRILDEGHYDVIHNNTLIQTIPLMAMAKKKKIPVRILHSHSTRLSSDGVKRIRNRLLLPVLLGCTTHYCACAEAAGRAMFGKKPFRVIPNILCAEDWHFDADARDRVRSAMNVGENKVIGTVGRTSTEKNPFFALDVIRELLKIAPQTEYWWIGDGPLDDSMHEYADKIGISGAVRFLGRRNDMRDLYQAMDCFFLPSLFEGLPMTGVEAQAMGLPMAVSDTVTKEMVYTDLVSFISLTEEKEDWARQINALLSRNVNREEYHDKLRKSAFSSDCCGERLQSIYREMLRAK